MDTSSEQESPDEFSNENYIKLSNKDKLFPINDKYKKIKTLGFGSYGSVLLVQDKYENKYSLKRFFFNQYFSPEKVIKNQFEILSKLDHPSLPSKIEIFTYKENQCILYEYYPYDLLSIIKSGVLLKKENENELKYLLRQILLGVQYLHKNSILHRDLKPDNLMISKEGQLKIIDFDLTKQICLSETQNNTKGVATIYYKPPEILFGDKSYTFNLDMWCIGCIFSEILLKKPIFEADNEILLLSKISEVLGAPCEENFPGVTNLPTYIEFNCQNPTFDEIMKDTNPNIKDLIKNLLNLDPKKRYSADLALKHSYFDDLPDKIKNLNLSYLLSN